MGAILLAALVAQWTGPFLLARVLGRHTLTAAQIWLLCLLPGALVGLTAGIQERDIGPNLFAGLVLATPPALLGLASRRWCANKPGGDKAFRTFCWWSLASVWFFAAGGFALMGLLAMAFGNTGPDGVWGTALKIGALGGGIWGLVLGGSVGLVRMLMLARQPSSAVLLEPEPPERA